MSFDYLKFSPRLPDFSGNRTIISNTLPIQEKWRVKLGGPVRYVVARDQQLWVWHGDWLSALDVATGQERWREPTDSLRDDPPAVGDNAIAYEQTPPGNHSVVVLNASSGQLKWRIPVVSTFSLAIGNGRVYVGTARLDAYDLESGKLAWDVGYPELPYQTLRLYYDSGKLYAFAEERTFVLDPVTGKILYSFIHKRGIASTITQNTIFDIDAHNIYSTDLRSGVLLWTKREQPRIFISPALIGQMLYVCTDDGDNVIAVDSGSGDQEWSSGTVKHAFSNIAELNGLGYVIGNDGRLRAFRLDTGTQVGMLDTGAGLPFGSHQMYALPSLVMANKTLIVSFGDAYLFGFQTLPSK
ncbi:MAG: PQQ-binding-like beta-propeller repeat protein [Anaerolineae bacterium]